MSTGGRASDDVHENGAFGRLVRETRAPHLIGQERLKAGMFGLAFKDR